MIVIIIVVKRQTHMHVIDGVISEMFGRIERLVGIASIEYS